jgi:hypothetical protein
MLNFVDDLAASGSPLRDDEFVAYLLANLDEEYNPVFMVIVTQTDPISLDELYAKLLSFEQHTSLQTIAAPGGSSSALAASRGRGYSGGCGSGSSDHGHGRGRGRDILHAVASHAVVPTVPLAAIHHGRSAKYA